MVAVGDTDWVPETDFDPLQPLEAVQAVASDEFHERVLDSPVAIESGDAVSETVGRLGVRTVNVALSARWPPGKSATTLTSSMRKTVPRVASVAPRNSRRTVRPRSEFRVAKTCRYPPASRFDNPTSVRIGLPDVSLSQTRRLSNTVVVVVSWVEIDTQKLRVTEVAVDGMEMSCEIQPERLFEVPIEPSKADR